MDGRSIRFPIAAAFLAFLSGSGFAFAEEIPFPRYEVLVTPSTGSFQLNRATKLDVKIVPRTKEVSEVSAFSFDAQMPQHKHGMVTKAKSKRLGKNHFEVEGVRLHMPGAWVLHFKLTHADGETKISSPLNLKP